MSNITVKRVRLSFPHLFEAYAFEAGQDKKFSAALLFNKTKDAAEIKKVRDAIASIIKEDFKGDPKGIKLCLREGTDKGDLDGYGSQVLFINASNKNSIPVVDADLLPLARDSGRPYAGCYCDVSIRLWAQNNKWGKRINAQLRAVKFVEDGQPFGDKPTDVSEVFEAEGDGGIL